MSATIHQGIVVSGGGAAGVAAAVAAAAAGMKVVLVEKNSYLGGAATAAEVGTICGLYKFSKNDTPVYCCTRFARAFAEAIRQKSGVSPQSNVLGLHYLPYAIEDFRLHCQQLLQQNQVTVLYNAEITQLEITSNNIASVSIDAAGGNIQINTAAVIDCSGHSSLSQLAGTPLIKSDQYQAAAQVFTLQQVPAENEAVLGMLLMKELHTAIAGNLLPAHFNRVYIVPGSLRENKVSLKIGIPQEVTHLPGNLQALQKTAHALVHQLTDYLIKNTASFKDTRLLHIAPEPGIRVGVRTMGHYVLTREDVLQCRKFEDAVAYGCWPMETWGQDKRAGMIYFNEDDYYHIPAGCLQSGTLHNLFMAGRCISATDAAIASARVIGTCLQTGYAAGWLAAAKKLGLSRQEAIKIIQKGECIS